MKVNKIKYLIVLLLLAVSCSFAQNTEMDAERHIKFKNFKKAREIYSILAKDNPENMTYTFWVARLSAWLGEFKTALKIYDSALKNNPTNNEALVGKAYILMWQKKYGKATKTLALAEDNDRYDAGFLIAKINALRYQNNFKKARETLKIAKEVHPENVEVAQLEKVLENAKSTKTEVGCQQDFEPFTATTTVCFANVTIEKGNNNISGRISTGRRFNEPFREVGVKLKRDLNNKTSINLSANMETQKKPNTDFNFGINHKINKQINISADYRIWRLNKRNIKMFSTNLAYSIDKKTQFQATFYKSSENTLLFRGSRQIIEPLSIGVTYLKSFGNSELIGNSVSQKAFTINSNYRVLNNFKVNGSFGSYKKVDGVQQRIYGFGFSLTK